MENVFFPNFRSVCEGGEDFKQAFADAYGALVDYVRKGVHVHPESGLQYFTGYSYGTLYDWDMYFETIVQFYCGLPTDYAVNGIRLFLDQQEDNGHITRTVPPFWWSRQEHAKPFLCQTALLCYVVDGHLDWLTQDMSQRLTKYLDRWVHALSAREGGLPVWNGASHTGMDNHMERAGRACSSYCEGVDLASYLVRETQAMSLISRITGDAGRSEHYVLISKDIADFIESQMWDDEQAMLFDIDARTGLRIPVKYSGAFAAMWASAISPDKARRMIEGTLLNPDEFWRKFPVPGLAASSPGYVEGFLNGDTQGCCSWRAHTWIPTNYYIMHGLVNYGFEDRAQELARRTFEMFFYYPFHEYYTSENGTGTGLRPFCGWSALAIFMLLEVALYADPTLLALKNPSLSIMRKQLEVPAGGAD